MGVPMEPRREDVQSLLESRDTISAALKDSPYSVVLYHQRAVIYEKLGYPDLAVMDWYKVILLTDETLDESAEFHEEARAALERDIVSGNLKWLSGEYPGLEETIEDPLHRGQDVQEDMIRVVDKVWARSAPMHIAKNLVSIGCLRTAYQYIVPYFNRPDSSREDSLKLLAERNRSRLFDAASVSFEERGLTWDPNNFDVKELPDRGFVRREVYPWNRHEEDRMSADCLGRLNLELKAIAPKLEVRVTQLPKLSPSGSSTPTTGAQHSADISKQLGLYAKANISPGENILCERSLLTANARMLEAFCDACGKTLPDRYAGANHQGATPEDLFSCPDCADVVFCSRKCLDLAQDSYHRAVCGSDIETLAKNVPAERAADALYTQLAFRAMAMSQTQEKHPLQLSEVRYIWGDFSPQRQETVALDDIATDPFIGCPRTLPYDFQSQVLGPLHFLELLDISVFEAPNDLAETWVYNTLLAKFRGTASARISTRDGRPETAAVHPFWCLANHSCDPNVSWEWAGEITFTARDKQAAWKKKRVLGGACITEIRPRRPGGITAGQEILNHYVDIDLPVQARREWGYGALGGNCRCERCLYEANED